MSDVFGGRRTFNWNVAPPPKPTFSADAGSISLVALPIAIACVTGFAMHATRWTKVLQVASARGRCALVRAEAARAVSSTGALTAVIGTEEIVLVAVQVVLAPAAVRATAVTNFGQYLRIWWSVHLDVCVNVVCCSHAFNCNIGARF